MSNLNRADICPMAWISLRINFDNMVICCYRDAYAGFPLFGGPWSADGGNWFNHENQQALRRSMLEHGAKATCSIERCDIYRRLQRRGSVGAFLDKCRAVDAAKAIEAGQSDCPDLTPVLLTVDPGLRCNMRCKFCVVSDETPKISPNLDQIRRLKPYFKGVTDYHTCGGDTFAYSDDHIDALHENLPDDAVAWVITNGLGLTLSRYEKYFVNGPLDQAMVSVQSMVPDTMAFLSGVKTGMKTHENLRSIASAYPDNGLATLSTVVMPQNISELPDLYRFAAECGFRAYRLVANIPTQSIRRGYGELELTSVDCQEMDSIRPEMDRLDVELDCELRDWDILLEHMEGLRK